MSRGGSSGSSSPRTRLIQFDFGMPLHFLATSRAPVGLFQSSERSSSAAVELLRPLSAASPGVARYKSELFHGLTRRAQALVRLGQHARADATIHEARALLDEMGPEDSLDHFERQRIAEIEQALGTLLAEQGRWTEAVPVLEANRAAARGVFLKPSDEWTFLRDLVESKAALVEARLRAGRISLAEAIAALPRFSPRPMPTRAGSTRPSIRFQRAEILFRQAAFQAEAGVVAEAETTMHRAIEPMEADDASQPRAPALEACPGPGRLPPRRAPSPGQARDPGPRRRPPRRGARSSRPSARAPAISTSWGHSRRPIATSPISSGPRRGRTLRPICATCLGTLNKAVSAGFDDSARLREDPRLKLLRERMKPEFERLVAGALAAGKVPSPVATAPGTTP